MTAAITEATEPPIMIFFFVDHLQKKIHESKRIYHEYHFDLVGISSVFLAVVVSVSERKDDAGGEIGI